MRIVLFSVFGFNVYSHGVFLVLGMVVAGYLYFRLAVREKLKIDRFLFDYIAAVVAGVVVSRIIYYLINLKYYNSFYQIGEFWKGGLVSFAGFIVGGLIFLLLLRIEKENIQKWLNMVGIAFPLGIAIGRIGCVLNGEVGKIYFGSFAYLNHFPVNVFEIYLGLIIFALNFSLYLYARKYIENYGLFFIFVIAYSFFRIFLDGYRADSVLPIGLNLSQLTSFIIFITASSVLSIFYVRVIKGKIEES